MRRLEVGGTILLLALLGQPVAARAEVALGFKVGTAGLGIELSTPFGAQLAGRLGLYGYSHGDTFDAGGIEYRGDASLRNALALLDWHPGGGGFRLSAGLAYTQNEVKGRAPIRSLFSPEDLEILPDDFPFELGNLRARVYGNPFGPYVGLGWGNAAGSGGRVSFSFDLGTFYQGEPQAELKDELPFSIDGIPGARELLDQLLAAEEAQLQDDVQHYRFFPVVAVGVAVHF